MDKRVVLRHVDYNNDVKANFDQIYAQPDPRDYYRVLYGLDYVIPDLAKPVFRDVIRALEAQRGRPLTVLDIGCSYGINAALIRFPLSLDRLAARCRDLDLNGPDSETIVDLDRMYFRSWPREDVRVIGLDVSQGAVDYARAVGLIDDGIVADLENTRLTDEQRAMLENVDLIISTGCIGYVGPKTFSQVIDAIKGERPWVASFVLRMFDYAPMEEQLVALGLPSDKLRGVTFVQRRFQNQDECQSVLDSLDARGIATEGKEAEGLYHAEFFLARPDADRDCLDLETLASVTSGANLRFGRRFRVLPDQSLRYGH